MKIQLLEAYHGGHHSNYIEALLPTLRRALETNQFSEALISVTPLHHELLIKSGIAKQESVNLRFSATLPLISPNPNLRDRYHLFDAFDTAIQAAKPDAVISTSADYDVIMNALFKGKAHFGGNTSVNAVGVFHYGYPDDNTLKLREKYKKTIYEYAWQHANWNRLLFVNPLTYESLRNRAGANAQSFFEKVSLLPDPVPPPIEIDMMEARQRLNIPTDGVYIGFIGLMDYRKAIPELLDGFVQAKAYESCRLLLAGCIAPEYQRLLKENYTNLIEKQRIIVIDRHLSAQELQLGYSAINIKALLQYRRMNLSANLLKAVAYGKPLIVDDFGYTGMMSRKFNLGYRCHVNRVESVVAAIKQALNEFSTFIPSKQTKKLMQFHHPDQYAKTVLHEMAPQLMSKDALLTWDWVNQPS